jgi:glucose dehydrogenase
MHFGSRGRRVGQRSRPVLARICVEFTGASEETRIGSVHFACFVVFAVLVSLPRLNAQTDWPNFGHDKESQRYSPLKQINVQNVSTLAPVWTYPLKNEGGPAASWAIESVPLVVQDRMYVSWPFCHVAALDPETGRQFWQYTAPRCSYRGPGLSSMRSMAYWPGDKVRAPRIVFGTEDGELYALDAKTGLPVEEFGVKGVVNLKTPEVMNGFPNMHYGLTSAPLVYQDLVITGSHIDDETGRKGPAGDVRAWDVRTGKLVWTFHTVPRPGEAGHEAWTGDTWKDVAGADVWSFFTVDMQRGILYMPVGSTNNDHYGVDRPGPDLFGNSLVAVDVKTGKLKWYFQAIHHDIWDYDMPAAPMLFDVVHDGKRIPAVAAMTKNPLLFILNRVTGKPIYGVEERPVPAGDLPGEWYSPTQPFPLKPPPLSRQSFTENDFAKITPEHEAACREWYAKFLERGGTPNKGPYTPSSANGTLQFPDHWGGAWMWGGAFDPELGYYIINTTDSGALHFIEQTSGAIPAPRYADPDGQSPILYGVQPKGTKSTTSFAAFSFSANGWPCWAPPWGRLTAVDVNTGDIAWQIPYGTMNGVPDGIKTGAQSSRGGPTTTAGGLIFMTGTFDHYLRALETKSGKELWSFKLNQVPLAVPIVYAGKSGKEYLAIAAGDTLVTFALASQMEQSKSPNLLPVQTQLPDGEGKELVQRVCSSCHSADMVVGHRQTRAGWASTIQRMAQHGASASDQQFDTIVDYLTKNFGSDPAPKN